MGMKATSFGVGDTVASAELEDGSVTAAKLGAAAVETAKIKDANVTADKLATDSVTDIKIASTFLKEVGSVNLTSAATSMSVASLVGDTDKMYLVWILIKAASTSGTFDIRLSNNTSNLSGIFLDGTGTAANSTTRSDSLIAGANDGEYNLFVIISAKTGMNRYMNVHGRIDEGADLVRNVMVKWADTSTAVTSIDVVCSQASGFDSGSSMKVFAVV